MIDAHNIGLSFQFRSDIRLLIVMIKIMKYVWFNFCVFYTIFFYVISQCTVSCCCILITLSRDSYLWFLYCQVLVVEAPNSVTFFKSCILIQALLVRCFVFLCHFRSCVTIIPNNLISVTTSIFSLSVLVL